MLTAALNLQSGAAVSNEHTLLPDLPTPSVAGLMLFVLDESLNNISPCFSSPDLSRQRTPVSILRHLSA